MGFCEPQAGSEQVPLVRAMVKVLQTKDTVWLLPSAQRDDASNVEPAADADMMEDTEEPEQMQNSKESGAFVGRRGKAAPAVPLAGSSLCSI